MKNAREASGNAGGSGNVRLRRAITDLAAEYTAVFRVVILNGPRQSGKTTLMHDLRHLLGGDYRDLDDEGNLQSAIEDPVGFVLAGSTPRFIDEVQRAGDPLVRAIKATVDRDWSKGQFVLAGSSRFLSVPTLSESLAGRAGILEVWPLSQGELRNVDDGFCGALLEGTDALRKLRVESMTRDQYFEMICRGGFPEPMTMTPRARASWFDNYIATVTDRDLREMARVNEPSAAGAVLQALAADTGHELVVGSVARRSDLSPATAARYVGLLEVVFLVHEVPVWSRNLSKRMTKHAKAYLVDTGLAAHILGAAPATLADPRNAEAGQLTETFVFGELSKQISWADDAIRLSHYREHNGPEIDFVLEHRDGRVAAVEVKAASTVRSEDVRHLAFLRDRIGDDFVGGAILHLGDQVLPFGDRITAMPLSALWATPALADQSDQAVMLRA